MDKIDYSDEKLQMPMNKLQTIYPGLSATRARTGNTQYQNDQIYYNYIGNNKYMLHRRII